MYSTNKLATIQGSNSSTVSSTVQDEQDQSSSDRTSEFTESAAIPTQRRRSQSLSQKELNSVHRSASCTDIQTIRRSTSASDLSLESYKDPNVKRSSLRRGRDGYYRNSPTQLGAEKIRNAKNSANSIVFKIGSTTLVEDDGTIKTDWINRFAKNVKGLKKDSKRVTIIASGAVATGRGMINGIPSKDKMSIPEKQLAAGVGQPKLMNAIQTEFTKYGLNVSQDLVSQNDMKLHSTERGNLLKKYNTAEKYDCVMIFNANDSVDISQLTGGDNDALALTLAGILKADTTVIFSDILGFHSMKPEKDNLQCTHIPIITSETIDHYIDAAEGPGSDLGTGGMAAKFLAIKDSFSREITTVITLGNVRNPGAGLFDTDMNVDATWFIPEGISPVCSYEAAVQNSVAA